MVFGKEIANVQTQPLKGKVGEQIVDFGKIFLGNSVGPGRVIGSTDEAEVFTVIRTAPVTVSLKRDEGKDHIQVPFF